MDSIKNLKLLYDKIITLNSFFYKDLPSLVKITQDIDIIQKQLIKYKD